MLCLNLKDLSIKNKNTICEETGLVKYWSQPDFAYKSRVHIYDSDDNEIGYVQYKILSIQDGNNCFYKDDKQIDLNEALTEIQSLKSKYGNKKPCADKNGAIVHGAKLKLR